MALSEIKAECLVVALNYSMKVVLPSSHGRDMNVMVGSWRLPGFLAVPSAASALVVFAHGSGSSRFSSRNRQVAQTLNHAGMATLLFDLLRPEEDSMRSRAPVFDIELLANRLIDAVEWADETLGDELTSIGLFGASTGAAAALVAAAGLEGRIGAVVSRGGRPDLAGDALERVSAPTLLIVGGEDHDVLELNKQARARMKCLTALQVVPGATHLFEEPGTLQQVMTLARDWFETYLTAAPT
jgi:putative phosphoribosyl transferase